jgi:hypothetical protein
MLRDFQTPIDFINPLPYQFARLSFKLAVPRSRYILNASSGEVEAFFGMSWDALTG